MSQAVTSGAGDGKRNSRRRGVRRRRERLLRRRGDLGRKGGLEREGRTVGGWVAFVVVRWADYGSGLLGGRGGRAAGARCWADAGSGGVVVFDEVGDG